MGLEHSQTAHISEVSRIIYADMNIAGAGVHQASNNLNSPRSLKGCVNTVR